MSAYAVSARGLVSRRIPQGVLAPMNALLFGSGQQGAWYDPSDLSTLFQDAAGTTPVTAMEQPVGRMLDLSGNGNHASQATTTKRGVVSRRVNLLTKTEDFADAAWGKANTSVEVMAGVFAPDGSQVSKLTATVPGGNYCFRPTFPVIGGTTYTLKFYAQAGTINGYAYIAADSGAILVNSAWAGVTAAGLKLVEYTFTTSPSATFINLYLNRNTPVGNVFVGGVSLTLATDSTIPYQRVNTTTDYDDNAFKFPTWEKYDGADDAMVSATGGGGNAGFFFSEPITVLGGAGTNRVRFSDAGTNTGYIVRLNASNQLELAAGNGTAYTTIATAGTLAVGTTDVVQAWDDGTTLNVKIGTGPTASIARPAVAAGTAGYTMGQDNGASTGYFNGRVYSTVYRKDSVPTQAEREAVALYQRQKARMP